MFDIGINPLEILWQMIIQTGTWVSALYSIVFVEWFEIPGLPGFSIWNMIVNPVTFILVMVAVVLKKVTPLL
jgi:hypothetical protein